MESQNHSPSISPKEIKRIKSLNLRLFLKAKTHNFLCSDSETRTEITLDLANFLSKKSPPLY